MDYAHFGWICQSCTSQNDGRFLTSCETCGEERTGDEVFIPSQILELEEEARAK